MFQEIILYGWRHICQHCYVANVANRSITSWLVYLAARLAATILNAAQFWVKSSSGQRGQFVLHHGCLSELLGPHPPRLTTNLSLNYINRTIDPGDRYRTILFSFESKWRSHTVTQIQHQYIYCHKEGVNVYLAFVDCHSSFQIIKNNMLLVGSLMVCGQTQFSDPIQYYLSKHLIRAAKIIPM